MSDFIKLPVSKGYFYLNINFIQSISYSSYSIIINIKECEFIRYELNDTNDAKVNYYFVLKQLQEKGIIV